MVVRHTNRAYQSVRIINWEMATYIYNFHQIFSLNIWLWAAANSPLCQYSPIGGAIFWRECNFRGNGPTFTPELPTLLDLPRRPPHLPSSWNRSFSRTIWTLHPIFYSRNTRNKNSNICKTQKITSRAPEAENAVNAVSHVIEEDRTHTGVCHIMTFHGATLTLVTLVWVCFTVVCVCWAS